jgi:hypothetical protein
METGHRRRRSASTGTVEQQLGHGPSSGIGNRPRLLSGATRRRTVTAAYESGSLARDLVRAADQSGSASIAVSTNTAMPQRMELDSDGGAAPFALMRQRACNASNMTEGEARRLLLERVGPLPPDQVLVGREVPAGWSLHVQARAYVESGEFAAQLVGQPIFLVRADGSVAEFPSHPEGYAAFEAAAGLTRG